MPVLTTSEATAIAAGVYELRTANVSDLRRRGVSLGCEGMFCADDGARFQGQSGALRWKALSGFGYIAHGEGRYQGEVLIATRGTKTKPDWLSNLKQAVRIGPGGDQVHAGFFDVWQSFKHEIQEQLRGRNPSVIHCVGHSLGGALATLNADYLSYAGVGQVQLYTFGAPRTGCLPFASSLTQRLGAENIHRVYHQADIVPMVPLFPFIHAPALASGLVIRAPDFGRLSVTAHFMEESYIPAMRDKSWLSLRNSHVGDLSDHEARFWLNNAAANQNGILMGAAGLSMIGRVLVWILKQAANVAVGSVFFAGATVLDQVVWLLGQAAELSSEIAGWVTTVMKAIMRFLGRTVTGVVQLTREFLRWVLELLFRALSRMAIEALKLVGGGAN